MPRSCAVHLHFVSGEQLMTAPVDGYKRFIYAFQLLDKCRFSVAVVVFLHFFYFYLFCFAFFYAIGGDGGDGGMSLKGPYCQPN